MINSIYFSHCYDALGRARDEGISVQMTTRINTDYDTDYDTGLFDETGGEAVPFLLRY